MFKVTGAKGNARVFRQIANIPRSMGRGLKNGNIMAGKKIQKDIRADMEKPKSGRVYMLREFWLGRGTIRHRASAPGEAPARLTGSLKASVNYIPSMTEMVIGAGTTGGGVPIVKDPGYPGQVDLGGQIGFGRVVDYARSLELRRRRPYLKKNIAANYGNTKNYYIRETGRELSKS
jgi:hypothetical protein